MEKIILDVEKCSKQRCSTSTCREHCEKGAIEFQRMNDSMEFFPKVDNDICDQCGDCIKCNALSIAGAKLPVVQQEVAVAA